MNINNFYKPVSKEEEIILYNIESFYNYLLNYSSKMYSVDKYYTYRHEWVKSILKHDIQLYRIILYEINKKYPNFILNIDNFIVPLNDNILLNKTMAIILNGDINDTNYIKDIIDSFIYDPIKFNFNNLLNLGFNNSLLNTITEFKF